MDNDTLQEDPPSIIDMPYSRIVAFDKDLHDSLTDGVKIYLPKDLVTLVLKKEKT